LKSGSRDKFSDDSHKIKRLITEACSEWAKYSDLKFIEVKDSRIADIVVSFENPYHIEIDNALMDESVLAHAFYPSIGFRWNRAEARLHEFLSCIFA
jgi:NAD+--asparagine ADP-ribosyltransferase